MAAQLEETLHEESKLIESSGGVFEVEDAGTLIFSKKKESRFPEEGEIIALLKAMHDGSSLVEAQAQSSESARKPPSFFDWLRQKLKR